MDDDRKITVGDLKRHLEGVPDHYELAFQGHLTFYRAKLRGPELLMIEFNEAQANLSAALAKDLKVAFLKDNR